ncbi:MAG TPA: SpvB/TcaC N-terminal domain-containing protein, partial [Labilithrix sp.]|nr:SpvB/TcaC N-terminal domain-containing protein [Labilithrix sp.]
MKFGSHPASAFVATVTLIAFVATLIGGPMRLAHAVEEVEPADTPNFSDSSNGVRSGADVASSTQKSAKARKAPVSARCSFVHSLSIQVPPGRLGMTPSLGLGYDSARPTESPVGAGWSFGVGRISRSTRLGYPAVTGPKHARTYDPTSELFTAPDGELVPTTDGPTGATRSFAPIRESSPVRYEFVSAQDRWVEHAPNGVKKYYGADPFDGRAMRVVNELGTFSWLLVREEDPYGNDIRYDYHNADSQLRGSRVTAQIAPVLSRVTWGGNRLTGQAAPFAVTTVIDPQDGPLDVLDGGTLLTSRVRRIDVSIDGVTQHTCELGYVTSADTGKALLRTFRRSSPPETTTFHYSEGAPSGPRFSYMGALHAGASDRFYTEGSYWYAGPFARGRSTDETAVQAAGHRAGVKFIDVDGNGTTDAIYHAAGIGTTSTHVLWEESRLQAPSMTGLGSWLSPALGMASVTSKEPTTGLPYFPLGGSFSRSDFTRGLLRDLVDLDGDGDADGVALFTRLLPRNRPNVAVARPPAQPHGLVALPWGEMPIRMHTNTARSGDVVHLDSTVPWPAGVTVESYITATQPRPDETPPPPLVYVVEPKSDVHMPAVDLNGDGKTDLALLKHRAIALLWNPGAAWAFPRDTIALSYSALVDPPPASLVHGDLEADVSRLVRGRRALVFVDEDLLNSPTRPESYVVAHTSAEIVGLSDIDPATPVVFMSAPGVIPTPQMPRPPSTGLPPKTEIPIPTKKPWWLPVIHPDGDVYLPLREKDYYRSHSGGIIADTFRDNFYFVPHVYLMRGEKNRALAAEGQEDTSNFELALQRLLNGEKYGECLVGKCTYPPTINFNTFFADLNGDGLPDLVKAPAPFRLVDGGGEKIVCPHGHEVYLNRGYTFENTENSFANFGFGADDTATGHPLRLVANRDRSCASTRPRMEDSLLGALELLDSGESLYPLGAMAQVDINADGRVDLVVAYQRTADVASSVRQRVFLNTGRGFREATNFDLPADVAIARNLLYPAQAGAMTPNPLALPWPRDGFADTARFVDIDGDGLVDIVSAGFCARTGLLTTSCTPARWYKNRGDIPDRLERIDEPSGAWTEVEYAGPKEGVVTVPEGGLRPPNTTRLVAKVRSSAGPTPVPAGFDAFPVQEVRVSYENYVRDVVSNEHIGF